jgi:hypothetical protein
MQSKSIAGLASFEKAPTRISKQDKGLLDAFQNIQSIQTSRRSIDPTPGTRQLNAVAQRLGQLYPSPIARPYQALRTSFGLLMAVSRAPNGETVFSPVGGNLDHRGPKLLSLP